MAKERKSAPKQPEKGDSPAQEREESAADQTIDVELTESAKTITDFLSEQDEERGVELDPSDQIQADDILNVEGAKRYEVGEVLSKGGMGAVYQAKDVNCRRVVAMKRLPTHHQDEEEDLLRFIEEAQITSQLEHPNIVPVHDLGLDSDSNVFYTMKYVKGQTLTDIVMGIRKGQQDTIEKYQLPNLLTVFQKVCDAVAFAHSKGVVHRDLKPDNIMIGDFGEVQVMDWGLAKVVKPVDKTFTEETVDFAPSSKEGSLRRPTTVIKVPKQPNLDELPMLGSKVEEHVTGSKLETEIDSIRTDTIGSDLRTMSGRIMGTPGFMSPEQALNREIDIRTDIYALGAILYCLLTLRPTVSGKIKDVLRRVVEGDIRPPTEYNRTAVLDEEELKEEGKKRQKHFKLPHCPDAQIPGPLSAIAMKALSINPDDRYATVQDFQEAVQSYQHGLIWNLVLAEDFTKPDLESRWEIVNAMYEIVDGELHIHGGNPQILLLKTDLPGDVRIEFECRQESVFLSTIGCFMGAIRIDNRKEVPASGYEFKYGGYDNSLNVVSRSDQNVWSKLDAPLIQGKTYRVRAERVGSRLRMTINGEEVMQIVDPDPLSGTDRTAVGLVGWLAKTCYSYIRVYTRSTPWEADVLDLADRQMQKGHYTTAIDLFEEVIASFPDARRRERADKGLATAQNRKKLVEMLPEWRARLNDAWPDSGVELRMDNDGLTAEISDAGIDSLEPFEGMPLTTLYCPHNRIESLEPLKDMPLATLNCTGNPIKSLEPLRGMPLKTLICESCGITSLEPLRNMQIRMLNCGDNKLATQLEPLKGLGLSWFCCSGCGIDSLEPLRSMPLFTLYCDTNKIESLAPLSDMPLTTLHTSGNRITTLEPLTSLSLSTLHCGNNQIASLEPLRGMPLNMLSCHNNKISSLEPLRGLPLGALVCGGNKLVSLEPFRESPPEKFLFHCESIPDEEIEIAVENWADSEDLLMHVRDANVLLAMRKKDIKGLQALASAFDGHKYLFMPHFLTWKDAVTFCKDLGGHLVTITSQGENDVVYSVVPGGSWFWIGLSTKDSKHAWVTGEPFEFQSYIDPVRRQQEGPKVFFSGSWSADVDPSGQNCFMIEWDE